MFGILFCKNVSDFEVFHELQQRYAVSYFAIYHTKR